MSRGEWGRWGCGSLVQAGRCGFLECLHKGSLGPGRKGPIKGSVYESGMNPIGNARRRFNVRFYIVAMTFLVFDVEIVFLYPWAVSFASLGGTEGDALAPLFLGRMLFFVLTTIVAFVYAWRKGVFRYD